MGLSLVSPSFLSFFLSIVMVDDVVPLSSVLDNW